MQALVQTLAPCQLCPRECGVNRLGGEQGFCETGRLSRLARTCVHKGEEPPLAGGSGSGTVFFAGCNLRCRFCQNHQISQPVGEEYPEVSPERLARSLLELQKQGVHNLNFVSPSHVIPQMAEAIWLAGTQGLSLPVVFNSNGYESHSILRMLEGFVDIYLPDLKYATAETSAELSGAANYSPAALASIEEMYRQVGPLQTDDEGVARSGLMVRHLVLPGRIDESLSVLRDLVARLGKEVTVSIMSQYYPAHRARECRGLDRTVTQEEYETVVDTALSLGLENLWVQEATSPEHYRPDFLQPHPFEF